MLAMGAILAASVGLMGITSPSLAQVYNVDHYKVYDNDDVPVIGESFTLMDQFRNVPPEPLLIEQDMVVDFYSPPVVKEHAPTDPNLINLQKPLVHYAWNRLDEPIAQPYRWVWIENQFGKQLWGIQDAEYVLSPSSKAICVGGPTPGAACTGSPGQGSCGIAGLCILGPIPDEDHYLCYDVQYQNPTHPIDPGLLNLEDQFHQENNVSVGKAQYVCNPAEKVHNAETFPIQNPDDHLACYKIDEDPFAVTIDEDQQFGTDALSITNAKMLCLPSTKELLPPNTQVPTFGRLGLALLVGAMTLTAAFWFARRRPAWNSGA
jgi:hypothetical protein